MTVLQEVVPFRSLSTPETVEAEWFAFFVFCSRILAQNLCSMKAICQRVAAADGLCFNRVLSLY